MDQDKEYALTLKEAYEIVDAHLRGRYTSIYLMDAWNLIMEELKQRGTDE